MLHIVFLFATAAGVFALCVLFLIALVLRKRRTALIAGLLGVGWIVLYVVLLLGFSLFGPQRIIAMNQPMPFCGEGCDLSVSVEEAHCIGSRCFITFRVRLNPGAFPAEQGAVNPRVALVDDRGNQYPPSGEADEERFDQFVKAGESFTKTFIFDPPASVHPPYIQILEGGGLSKYMIDDDNSLFHKAPRVRLEFR
jgi:hypothetical protein